MREGLFEEEFFDFYEYELNYDAFMEHCKGNINEYDFYISQFKRVLSNFSKSTIQTIYENPIMMPENIYSYAKYIESGGDMYVANMMVDSFEMPYYYN